MRAMSTLLLLSMLLVTPALRARQAAPVSAPLLTWGEIEVVTDREALAPAIRAATGLTPGERIALTDPRLKSACDAVRASYPRAVVACRGMLNGAGEAMYVVELETAARPAVADPSCDTGAGLPADLGALRRRLSARDEAVLLDRTIVQKGEFVNAAQSLDNLTPELHAIDAEYAAALAGRLPQLASAAAACDAAQRADAIMLMNYAGDARTAVRYAAHAMHDTDAGVRNNAFRLLGSFAAFVDADALPAVARGACEAIGRVSFFDRNKGMTALQALVYRRDFPLASLPAGCLQVIRRLAAGSHSDQIGAPAKMIARRVDKTPAATP